MVLTAPPAKHRALTGQKDPHEFQHGRLGLDRGSVLTGVVTGAEIQDGRYRIKAGRPRSPWMTSRSRAPSPAISG
ncbi:MAG: hypothetical protein GEV13_23375 [Rhodospirillales bacterium]|nr:hypothetical protein [Rhodospirillales bacterium]